MSFKWKNRKKATEVAIQLKNEEKITAEDAVKKVLAEYEGTYFTNGSEISETRYNNFIKRVEEEKQYKNTTPTPKKSKYKNKNLVSLVDSGDVTKLQAKVLDMLLTNLEGFSIEDNGVVLDAFVKDSNMKPLQIKNSIRHLEKKGFIIIKEVSEGDESSECIFLNIDKEELNNLIA